MVEVVVAGLGIEPCTNRSVIVLRDKKGTRVLPICIGPLEASSIALALEGAIPPRPLTHDLMVEMLRTAHWDMKSVLINDIREDTFYARISLDFSGSITDIDSRPSDAIALALRTGAPIYAENKVMEEASVLAAGTDFSVH